MYPHEEKFYGSPSNAVSDDTVSSLRHRLKSLKDAFGDDVDDDLLNEADSLMSRTGSKSADELLRSSNRRASKRKCIKLFRKHH